MKRREFIALVGGAAAIWSSGTYGQQPKVAKIGVLVTTNPEPFWTTFRQGMSAHGYVEGKNVQFELRSGGGNADRLNELSVELVRLNVDIIVASLTPAVLAARQATTEIPIVMAYAGDPLGTGLVASLARPGANITGLSGFSPELAGKMLQFIREMLPTAQRVAVLANATDPFTKPYVKQIEDAGRSLGIAIRTVMVRGSEEFDAAFATMAKEGDNAVVVQGSLSRKGALEEALKHHLPPFGSSSFFAREGGLMSYSADETDLYSRAVSYIDRILKGAKPADLPVEQPTKFELVLNLKTAKALGLTFPPQLLAIATEVIE